MNRILLPLLGLQLTLSLFFACTTLPQQDPSLGKLPDAKIVPLVGNFKVHQYIFDNGLKLLVVQDPSSPTFAYQTWYRVGSRDEKKGLTGLAHLFEHMMFKQTKNLKDKEFDRLLEQAGVQGENAFTSRDYTAYIQELPKDKIGLIVRLEADRMDNLVISDQSFKTEREVVQNERRFRNENNPDGILDQTLFETAFTQHPYHNPIIGSQQDLDTMSSIDALAFYKAYYSPNHATIAVVGDLKPDDVRDLVHLHYGKLKRQDSPINVIPAEPLQTSTRRKTLSLNIQVEKLFMSYHVPEVRSADIPALIVTQAILTQGKSSRLARALIDTGIAASADSYDLDDKDPSLFTMVVGLQKERHAVEAEAVILKEIAKLSKVKVSDNELVRTKNKLNFAFYEGMNANFTKAYFLGHSEAVAGDFQTGIQQKEKIQAVTADQIQEVVKRYLKPHQRTVITGVPK